MFIIDYWIEEQHLVRSHDGRVDNNKMNGVLLHTTAWLDLGNITVSKRSQSQKSRHCMIPFTWNVWRRQVHRGRKRSVFGQGWGDGREKDSNWYGHRVSYRGDKNILQLCWMVAHLCDYTKNIKLSRVNEWIYKICESDHNKAVFKKSMPWTAKVQKECSSLKDLMKRSVWTLLVCLAGKKYLRKTIVAPFRKFQFRWAAG